MSGEPNILTYTKFKVEKGTNKLQIKLASEFLLSKLKVLWWPVGWTRLVLNGFYMDVHICAAHQAAYILSEHFAPMQLVLRES